MVELQSKASISHICFCKLWTVFDINWIVTGFYRIGSDNFFHCEYCAFCLWLVFFNFHVTWYLFLSWFSISFYMGTEYPMYCLSITDGFSNENRILLISIRFVIAGNYV